MGGEKGVLVVKGTDLEGKIREGEPAASRRGWQAVEKYRPHSPLGAPAGEEGPLRLSSLLVLGLLASGGAQGQGGLFRQGKLHHGGQVQLATAGHKGGGDLCPTTMPSGVQPVGRERAAAPLSTRRLGWS